MAGQTARILTSDGAELAVWIDGPESAPALTFTHSLAASSSMWWPQVDALSLHFRIVRMDFRGHGASSIDPAPTDFSRLALDVVETWNALGIERSHYCGLSLGGIVGGALAIEHGERIDHLILADCRFDSTGPYLQQWKDRSAHLEKGGMAAIADITLPTWITADHSAQDQGLVEVLRQGILATDPQGWRNIVAIFPRLDLKRDLWRINNPTLFLTGSDDGVRAELESCASLVPSAQFAIIEDAAHLANADQPERFSDALRSFLPVGEAQSGHFSEASD